MSELNLPGVVVESHLHPVPSFDLADHPLPTGREEIWRFTPLDKLAPLLDESADWAFLPGQVTPAAGVTVGELAPGQAPRGQVLVPVDRPSAIAARLPIATHISLSGTIAEPVTVALTGAGPGRPQASHIVIDAQPGSHAIVVLEHTGSAVFLGNVEIIVGDGADLTVVSLQEWAADALHAGLHQALVGRDAHYRHVAMTIGGSLVRLQNNLSYAGPGGLAELFGLYLTDGYQHQEHRLFIDQNQPKTTSRVDYRGALQGKGAHSVWVGDVLIRRNAEGIDSYEANKNLLLTNGCIADSVPNLEIETGNIVGAGHSSATGRFDDEQLFYLESRGIPEAEARRLVVQGFFYEIIRRIGVPAIETRLRAAVNAELASATGDTAYQTISDEEN